MAKKILSLILALAMIFSVGCVSAFAEEATVSKPLVFTEDAEHKLFGTFAADGYDGAIQAANGAKLTINGTDADIVKGLYFDNYEKNYTMAVWAHGEDTEVVINGGYYTNEPDPEKKDQADLIYASLGAKIVINGGTFKCATPRWTLNCKNNSGSTITVKGGKFYQFDPSNAKTDGENEIVVPAGYTVNEVVESDGTWYEVVSNAKVYNGGEAKLTLSGSLVADGEDGAIRAENKANLTIEGTDKDTVKATYVTKYTMAVWAKDADTVVTINGGYYENEGDPEKTDQADLIYAKGGAKITINGGTFKCATPRWTLNCSNGSGSTITVMGGKFYQFDPSNAKTDGENEIVVPKGYAVVKNGDWYEVVKGEEASIVHKETTGVEKEGKGAIRFVFEAEIPAKTKTYFGAYLLPLDIFKASGVANAVQVQYDTEVDTVSTFSADLVEIPENHFGTNIYAIPYIKTANGVVTFAGATASVSSALAE